MALAPSTTGARPASTVAVPLFATRPAIESLLPEVAARQREVLESGRYILGPEVEAFEREFAAFVGRRHCIGVANGTEAITIALRALGIQPGDEVIVPGYGFFATPEAVVNAGAVPVFADIDPWTHCVTAATVAPVITPRTRAIVPVHIFGNPAPMDELLALARDHDLVVLEDAAQAAGARLGETRAGAFGQAATFSFYPGKNLGAFGDAGAIVTDDPEVARTARLLRAHGQDERWVHEEVGYNSRLDELQAAALRVLLRELPAWTTARRLAARAYERHGLGDLVTLPVETAGARSCFHLYVVLTKDRDRLSSSLREVGIETRPYYTRPLHRQPALVKGPPASLPNCERLAADGLALPMGQCLEETSVRWVVEAIRALS